MATWTIPVDPADASQELEVELAGTIYRLALAWNTRGEFWSLVISTQTGDPIVAGVRLVADWPLLDGFQDPRLPVGTLMAMDTSGGGIDPTEADLGTRVLLVYDDGK